MTDVTSQSSAAAASPGPAAGSRAKAEIQPPVAYLPCRLDADGGLAEVMMARLADGRVALMGYTALDRFFAGCGGAHPWVLWKTEELEALRRVKHFDVAYLDVPMPPALRIEDEPASGGPASGGPAPGGPAPGGPASGGPAPGESMRR